MDDAHHRLRRPAGARPGPHRLAGEGRARCSATGSAARPARTSVRHPAGDIEVFTTRPGHAVRRHLHGAGAGAPAGRRADRDGVAGGTPRSGPAVHATPAEAVAAYRAAAARSPSWTARPRAKAKTGVFTGSFATNPVNGEPIPVFIADYVLMGYGTGAIMAVPGQDERDWEFAEVFELPIVRTVAAAGGLVEGKAVHRRRPGDQLADEASWTAWTSTEAKAAIIDVAGGAAAPAAARSPTGCATGCSAGSATGASRSRSSTTRPGCRSRCRNRCCRSSCPRPTTSRRSPSRPTTPTRAGAAAGPADRLGRRSSWTWATARSTYRRETNTMPNWAGSCWYELRYLDPTNAERLVDPEVEQYWMGPNADRPLGGVELYVGGVEHAVLHLLYARFWHKVLFDLGYVSSRRAVPPAGEPGQCSARVHERRRLLRRRRPRSRSATATFFFDGEQVSREFGKIGKIAEERRRRRTRFTPPTAPTRSGCSRCSPGRWSSPGRGTPRRSSGRTGCCSGSGASCVDEKTGDVARFRRRGARRAERLLHKTIPAVREGYETLRFNTSIARITELNNALTQAYPHGGAPRAVAEPLVLMLAPLAPHVAEELWSRLGHDDVAGLGAVPGGRRGAAGRRHDRGAGAGERQGARRASTVPADADAAAMEAAARADERVVAGAGRARDAAGRRRARPAGQLRRLSLADAARSASRSSPTRRPACRGGVAERRRRGRAAARDARRAHGRRRRGRHAGRVARALRDEGAGVDLAADAGRVRGGVPAGARRPARSASCRCTCPRRCRARGSRRCSPRRTSRTAWCGSSTPLDGDGARASRCSPRPRRAAAGASAAEVQGAATATVDAHPHAVLRRHARVPAPRRPDRHGRRAVRDHAVGQAAAADGRGPDRGAGEGAHVDARRWPGWSS